MKIAADNGLRSFLFKADAIRPIKAKNKPSLNLAYWFFVCACRHF